MFDNIKEYVAGIVKSRLFVLVLAFILLFAILLQRVFYLQIVKGDDYLENFTLQIKKTKEIKGTRGNIYDRNGKLLAYDELSYSVTMEDNGTYDTRKEKNKELNKTIKRVIEIVEENKDSTIKDFGIILDSKGKFVYSMDEGTKRLRFIADVYGKKKIGDLKDDQKNVTAQELMDYLCYDERYGFDIPKHYSNAMKLKMVNIRYAINLNSFQKYIATNVAENVSENTVAVIMENMDTLQGVDIAENSLRKYPDSKYFASIIGYTGKISQEEYDDYSKKNKSYTLTDLVGKAGIEQLMDSSLQGKKGQETVYVNNVGKVLKTSSRKEPAAGNNLYLTIDKDLQIATYKLLEQKLAGILLTHIANIKEFKAHEGTDRSKIPIPIYDVYFTFFNNELLDIEHFGAKDAGDTEKSVYQKYQNKQESALGSIKSELTGDNPSAYKDLGDEMKVYQSYIVNDMLLRESGVLMKEKINEDDETYKAWKDDESISLKKFLTYAISQNWVDTSKLNVDTQYSNTGEVYSGLVDYITEYLKDDVKFNKKLFKYMLLDDTLSGTEVCLLLLEQGVVKYNESEYNSLRSGSTSAYSYICSKIEKLAITPAQLGLEPCSGSAVITDVKTGEVRACVSYPGYDNNKLANTMDADYYQQLQGDLSKPLFNYATQQKTAPGSTFKMVSSIAGLEEGVISTGTPIRDEGKFTKVEPQRAPKCWIYPSSHGTLNVVGAIQNSCNYFFYDVGYRLSKMNSSGNYSTTTGLDKLHKYADLFGLSDKSGLELTEAKPEISTEDPVRSAIGQGTHNYTTSQMARYVTTIANGGTCYNLSLLGKLTNNKNKTLKDYKPSVRNKVNSTYIPTVQQGMRQVVTHTSSFKSLNVALAGKTGTAQQGYSHANHAWFLGFAPYDDPEISMAIRIANGYTSANSAEVARDIMKYYYKQGDVKSIITGTAQRTGSSISD